MPYHRKTDFAALCGVTPAAISMSVKRRRLILTDAGLVDDQEPINQQFMVRSQENAKKKALNGEGVAEAVDVATDPQPARERVSAVATRRAPLKPRKRKDSKMDAVIRERMGYESTLKREKAALTSVEASMLKMKEERLRGQLIPSALIRPLFATHFQSLIITFKQAVDAMLADMSQKVKLNANQQAELRKRMVEEINLAVDRGISQTENSVDNIMQEYISSRFKSV